MHLSVQSGQSKVSVLKICDFVLLVRPVRGVLGSNEVPPRRPVGSKERCLLGQNTTCDFVLLVRPVRGVLGSNEVPPRRPVGSKERCLLGQNTTCDFSE